MALRMITLYKAIETNFEHNGLGVLSNESKAAIVEEEINGLYTLSMSYPITGKFGKVLKNQMIIKAPTPQGPQLFRVYKCEPSMGQLEITCLHIFYDLAFNIVEDTNIVNKSAQAWLQQLGSKTQYRHAFQFFSNISSVASARIVRKNIVEVLLNTSLDNSFVSLFGGEILRDNFNIYFNQAIGRNNGFKIIHKKNLKGYEAFIDDQEVLTRIMPIGFDGLLLPEKYVDSPRIGDYPFPRIGKVKVDVKAAIGEYADDEDALPIEEAYKKMRQLVREQFGTIDVPKTSYDVDFVELSKTKEYEAFRFMEEVHLGDTVKVEHREDNFKATSKVIKYRFDSLRQRFESIELGHFVSRVSDNSINEKRSLEQRLETVKEEAANMIQLAANGKNAIYRGAERPTNAQVGDLWYEPIGYSVILKQWSGTDWEVIPISDQNLGNVNINNLSGNAIDIKQFRLSNGETDIMYVNHDGEAVLNVKHLSIDATQVATKKDLEAIELTQGPAGKGIVSTELRYLLTSQATGVTRNAGAWGTVVQTPTATQRYVWAYRIERYSDGTSTTGEPYVLSVFGEKGIQGLSHHLFTTNYQYNQTSISHYSTPG
ncbi:phage tail spike protein, partial [Streptococcus porci]